MDKEQMLELLAQIEQAGGIDYLTPELLEQLLMLGPAAEETGAAMAHPETGEYSPHAVMDYLQAMTAEPESEPIESAPGGNPSLEYIEDINARDAARPSAGLMSKIKRYREYGPRLARDASRIAQKPWKEKVTTSWGR